MSLEPQKRCLPHERAEERPSVPGVIIGARLPCLPGSLDPDGGARGLGEDRAQGERMDEFLHRPGFLGTNANLAADFTLVVILLTAGLFSLGVWLARHKHYGIHRWVQTTAALLNAGLVLWMMILPFRDFVAPGIPGKLSQPFYAISAVHGLIGASGLLLGLFVVLRANGLAPKPLRFSNYRLFMRLSYGLYMLATLLGVLVYLTWFVWSANPPSYGLTPGPWLA
jgi:uncharacterized membrane protein YozB (DUF420 family)